METLIKIQNELKVPKSNVNAFGKYKYRSAEDILEAVKPLLHKHKATVYLTDDIILIGTKIFLKATATLHDDKGEHISVNGFAETTEHKGMSAEQTTGTASSYARKYALNGLFLIDETEQDADSQNTKEDKKEPVKVTEWLTEEQFRVAVMSDKKGILATLKAYNGQNGKGMKSEYLKELTAELSRLGEAEKSKA